MWKCARFPFLSITVRRGKVASRHRRSQMASKSMARGRNTALYQRFSCLPTHRQRERGESTSMRVDRARVDDWEVHSVPSSSVRDSVNQRKHKDQTVLQVVLEAQLCANFTGNVLFCLWLEGKEWGGFQLPLHTVHMEEDGKGISERVREQDSVTKGL